MPFSFQVTALPPIVPTMACFIAHVPGKPFLQSFGNNLF